MKDRVILHMDADSFFASCHIIKENLPSEKVVVTSDLKKGIILSATYDCKKAGVYTTMPIWKAKKIIPDLIIIESNHKIYKKVSEFIFKHIQAIFHDKVYLISIDECYIDITNFISRSNTVYQICTWIKDYIYKISNLNFSIGAANTFFYAKMASKFAKPNGIKIIKKHEQQDFIKNIDIKDIYGIGKSKQNFMYSNDIYKGADLFSKKDIIKEKYKKAGTDIINNIEGILNHNVIHTVNKSFGKEISIKHNFNMPINYYVIINNLFKQLYFKLQFQNIKIKCIKVKIKSNNKTIHKQKTINKYTNDPYYIKKYIIDIFDSIKVDSPINLIGIYFSNITNNIFFQKKIFNTEQDEHVFNKTDAIIYKLNQNYNKKIFFNIKKKKYI